MATKRANISWSDNTISDLSRSAVSENSLVPRVGHPFFIVAPAYTRSSAGITVLHMLCHHLNLLGESAFIVRYPPQWSAVRSLPSYCTLVEQAEFPGGMLAPILTRNAIEFYHEKRLTPIVIYPEVYDNPLGARFFGRYILNFPGKIVPGYKDRENFSFAYTKTLADAVTAQYPDRTATTDVLFVPTCDLEFWNPKGASAHRRGTCYYCAKMKDVHGEQPENVPEGSVEILRGRSMRREQIRELFWNSEAFYCYEDTALAIEATLCGCPTVHVPNRHYSGSSLARNELGTDGSCLIREAGGLVRAQNTVARFRETMRRHIALTPSHIAELAAKWRTLAAAQEYQGTIKPPLETLLVYFDQHVPDVPAPLGFAATDGEGPGLPAPSGTKLAVDGLFNPLTIKQALAALLMAAKRSIAYRFPRTARVLRRLYRLAIGRPLKDDNARD
jgi:hypothetical protein